MHMGYKFILQLCTKLKGSSLYTRCNAAKAASSQVGLYLEYAVQILKRRPSLFMTHASLLDARAQGLLIFHTVLHKVER